jgi:hypothetical protein
LVVEELGEIPSPHRGLLAEPLLLAHYFLRQVVLADHLILLAQMVPHQAVT